MPELRQDPVSGHWVILAKKRAQRPHDFVAAPRRLKSGPCPFCEGHEHQTPGELLAYRTPGSQADAPGWRVRVVPNKFPAVESTACIEASIANAAALAGIGAHEVIVESPQHKVSLTELAETAAAEVFACYRERLLATRLDERLKCAVLFKNVGADAGASIEHVHSQLVTLPLVPRVLLDELSGARTYFDQVGRCIFCAMLDEAAAQQRLVLADDHFMAVCPIAPRFAYETWILPRVHRAQFEACSAAEVQQAGLFVRRTLEKIEAVLDQQAYNYIIHTAPFDMPRAAHYHWHIEILPRVTSIAGFECGSGMYINAVAPEEAAAVLREQ